MCESVHCQQCNCVFNREDWCPQCLDELLALPVGSKIRVFDEHFPNGRNGRIVKIGDTVEVKGVELHEFVVQFTRGWVAGLAEGFCKPNRRVEVGWKRTK